MRDAGHRTPDAGHRTSDGEKSKNNISTPQGVDIIYSWKVLKSQKLAITHLAIGIDSQVAHHVVAVEIVAE